MQSFANKLCKQPFEVFLSQNFFRIWGFIIICGLSATYGISNQRVRKLYI